MFITRFKRLTSVVALAIACYMVPHALMAMDVVTLSNGNVLRGEIYQRDEDGALYLTLTDGTKRYVMPDEIGTISNDNIPFKITTGSSDESEPINITIYAGFDDVMPTSIHYKSKKADVLNAQMGFVIGANYNWDFKYNLSFIPGIEFSCAKQEKYKKQNWSKQDWVFALRAPIQVAYTLKTGKTFGFTFHTGPVLDIFFGEEYYLGFLDKSRVNLDWRFGAKFNYNIYSLGISYTVGMTNRINDKIYDPEFGNASVRMRANTLQITLGVTI